MSFHHKNIFKSLLRDIRSLKRDQESALKRTQLIEKRLEDLIEDRPKFWQVCGLKIYKSGANNRDDESHFSNSIRDQPIYDCTPYNLTEYQTAHL